METHSADGNGGLVAANAAVFILFAFAHHRSRTRTDRRTPGMFSAFLVALFTEMYGFPLTLYLLSGWLIQRLPGVDLFSHRSGHLWSTLLGETGDAHLTPLHLLSSGLLFGGFALLAAAWRVLLRAQRSGTLARTGPYARIRHPQVAAFGLVRVGFLLQWPRLPTLFMFPVLAVSYHRLARREERRALEVFGEAYERYRTQTPAFVPRLGGRRGAVEKGASPWNS